MKKTAKWPLICAGIAFFVLLSVGAYMGVGYAAHSPEALLRDAAGYLRAGESEQALEAYMEAIGRDALDMRGYEGAAQAYLALGEDAQAEEILRLGALRADSTLLSATEALAAEDGEAQIRGQAPNSLHMQETDYAQPLEARDAATQTAVEEKGEEASAAQTTASKQEPTPTPQPTENPDTFEDVWVESARLEGFDGVLPQIRGLLDTDVQTFINNTIASSLMSRLAEKKIFTLSEEEGGEAPVFTLREAWRIGKVAGLRIAWEAEGREGTLPIYVDLRNGALYDATLLFKNPLHKLKTIEAFVEPRVLSDTEEFEKGKAYDNLYYAQPEVWVDESHLYFLYNKGDIDGRAHSVAVPMEDIENFAPDAQLLSVIGGFSDGKFEDFHEIIAAND